jgi:MFS family permease
VSAFATYRGLLSNGPLSRLLVGEFVSGIGDWLYLVALLVLVYRETADPVLLGIVGAARILPYVLLSAPAGIVADRFDRRMVLLVTDVARGLIMLALAAITAVNGPLAVIVALAILATCFATFFGPTIGSYLPTLVRDERELGPANSAWATLDNLAFVIGPAVGGILIAGDRIAPAFVLNAVTFMVIAFVLWGLPSSTGGLAGSSVVASDGTDGSIEAPTAERALRLDAAPVPAARDLFRPLAGLTVLEVAARFVFGGLAVMTVIIATDQLAVGDQATGYLNAAIGVGGLVGALGSGVLVLRRNLASPLLVGAIVAAIGLVVLGGSTLLPLALFGMALAAGGDLVTDVVSTTVFQRIVPDAVRGRAIGTMRTVSTLAFAAGSLLMPVLAARIGTLEVLGAGGILVVIAAVVAVALVGPGMRRSADEATETLRRVSRLPIFAGVPPAALETAAARLRPVSVLAGTVIVREGEPADRFYLIEHGAFGVDQRDPASGEERRLRVMGPNEVFGELGLLHRAPRSATVTALEDGRLLALAGDAFLELASAGPGLAIRLVELRGGPGTFSTEGKEAGVSAG